MFEYQLQRQMLNKKKELSQKLIKQIEWDESLTWETKEDYGDDIVIRPINFNTEHKNMLSNLHAVVSKGFLAIDPKYDKLLTSMRTAWANELNLDKQRTSYNDLLDSCMLRLKGYQIE